VSDRHWLRFRAAVTGDPTLVVDRLLAVLDKHDVVRALDRLKRRRIFTWSNKNNERFAWILELITTRLKAGCFRFLTLTQ
jgi:hypothetical protein